MRAADTIDWHFVHELVELYLSQLDQLAAAVGRGLRNHDHQAGQRAAHTLRSSSAQVGAMALANLCRRLESDEHADTEALACELNDLVKATRTALEGNWIRLPEV